MAWLVVIMHYQMKRQLTNAGPDPEMNWRSISAGRFVTSMTLVHGGSPRSCSICGISVSAYQSRNDLLLHASLPAKPSSDVLIAVQSLLLGIEARDGRLQHALSWEPPAWHWGRGLWPQMKAGTVMPRSSCWSRQGPKPLTSQPLSARRCMMN